jgi:hypothetical protein
LTPVDKLLYLTKEGETMITVVALFAVVVLVACGRYALRRATARLEKR